MHQALNYLIILHRLHQLISINRERVWQAVALTSQGKGNRRALPAQECAAKNVELRDQRSASRQVAGCGVVQCEVRTAGASDKPSRRSDSDSETRRPSRTRTLGWQGCEVWTTGSDSRKMCTNIEGCNVVKAEAEVIRRTRGVRARNVYELSVRQARELSLRSSIAIIDS